MNTFIFYSSYVMNKARITDVLVIRANGQINQKFLLPSLEPT